MSLVSKVFAGTLLCALTSVAQPWSVPATNKPMVRPPSPDWAAGAPPVTPVVPQPPPVAQPLPPQVSNLPLPAGMLAFDAEQKECTAKPGDQSCSFSFAVTNISAETITITHVQTSCGCTTAHIQLPMVLAPAGAGEIPINMNIQGKMGAVIKTVTVHSDKGQKVLLVKSIIPAVPPDPAGVAMDRNRNQQLALADRQAVFKGDCAKCHVEPVIGKLGKDLFAAACGICHTAEHRATMVPDLHQLKVATNADYWRFFIVNGKPATLMPAFAQAQGGPLSDVQINSLVDYLVKDFPTAQTNAPAAATH